MSYIILDIEVSKASALQTAYILTPLPVFAAVMLAHALDAELGKKRLPLNVRGVGLVHRSASPWIEHLEGKTEAGAAFLEMQAVQQRAGCLFDGVSKPISTSRQPGLLTDLSWTLLLHCKSAVDDSALDLVKRQILDMRLAGGNIKSVRARMRETWTQALGAVGRGYWIDDASGLIANHKDPALSLVASTQDQAWTLPVTLGYSLIERPVKERKGARDAKAHAYAQHMIGLVRLRSVRTLLASNAAPTSSDLWRWGWVGDEFVVSNKSDTPLCAKPMMEVQAS